MVSHHDRCKRQIRDNFGDAAFTEGVTRGRSLTYEEALAYALDEPRQPGPRPHDAPTPLTRREGQVADLIAQGLSNREISAKLIISQRTAESHVEHILTKLGLTSRAQVAARQAAQKSGNQDL